MNHRRGPVAAVSRFLHDYFLWLLLASYAAAALWPACGLWVMDVSLGAVVFFGGETRLTLPMFMLALLLVNAGLGVDLARLTRLLRNFPLLAAGLAAKLLLPIAFIFGVCQLLRGWHDPVELQRLLVGLALVAAMPVAASSTAWSQDNNGSMELSLGLVVLSTLLSLLTTPAVLHALEWVATRSCAEDLHRLAGQGTGAFLIAGVVLPSFLGILGRVALGGRQTDALKPHLKVINPVVLLLLNYSNGSVFLPRVMADPSWDFLAVTLACALGLCLCAFATGWGLARLFRAAPAERTSLLFGVGMTQVGTGLVLASVALAYHPRVMLPIIFYNLVQNLAAGVIALLVERGPDEDEPPPGRPGECAAQDGNG
jgi:BASS family bile acid:Na+ symporter